MEIQIKLGDYELIYSLSIIQIENSPIVIELPDTFGEKYVLKFQFLKDQVNRATVTKTTAIDKQHLNIDFVNFYDPDKIGNVSLLDVGALHEKPLFLNYRVIPLEGASNTVLFNFYVRKGV